MPPRPQELARKLKKLGFDEYPGRGAHRFFVHPDGRTTVISFHRRELKKPTYLAILKQAGVTEEEIQSM